MISGQVSEAEQAAAEKMLSLSSAIDKATEELRDLQEKHQAYLAS